MFEGPLRGGGGSDRRFEGDGYEYGRFGRKGYPAYTEGAQAGDAEEVPAESSLVDGPEHVDAQTKQINAKLKLLLLCRLVTDINFKKIIATVLSKMGGNK